MKSIVRAIRIVHQRHGEKGTFCYVLPLPNHTDLRCATIVSLLVKLLYTRGVPKGHELLYSFEVCVYLLIFCLKLCICVLPISPWFMQTYTKLLSLLMHVHAVMDLQIVPHLKTRKRHKTAHWARTRQVAGLNPAWVADFFHLINTRMALGNPPELIFSCHWIDHRHVDWCSLPLNSST